MTNRAAPATFSPMASFTEFAARGKVTGMIDGKIIFAPSNTNYELHLTPAKPYDGPYGELISALVRVKARKVYTVPSGGGFITPLFGPPKIIQGRALHVDNSVVVVRAGLPVIADLPQSDDAVDLDDGVIALGRILNIVALPGATFEALNTLPKPAVAQAR